MDDQRFICIHGHFYQPPRENPWLETIELQDSAYPYHDWNERVTAECYAPNTTSRILNNEGLIDKIVNNCERISFNFGPTLLAWLEEKEPQVLEAIVQADVASRERFSGHGSAMAQIYNHMIMPLANRRDKETQVIWGLRDFEYRFGRKAEGMWLPETAVDVETLEVLAENDVRFTILEPGQIAAMRSKGGGNWQPVNSGNIDPTRAYECPLPSGRSIVIFVYDGPASRAVAFEGLLKSGEKFANRLVGLFNDKRTWPQLVHIATDGESYGHHHRHGEMALSYALQFIEKNNLAKLTNYGEYLERFPPQHEVQIRENTSWSCAHGIERWRSDCGCNSGRGQGWHQRWREPLRQALDHLRDAVAPLCEQASRELLRNLWITRNDHIEVVLRRTDEITDQFLQRHSVRPLSQTEKISVLKILELQRHAMLMYTSCAWFFDEISGIETVQVLQYAARVIQLAEELFGEKFELSFLSLLEQAPGNVAEFGNGRMVYERFAKRAMVDLTKVGAHFALSSLFDHQVEATRLHCYRIDLEKSEVLESGKTRLSIGRARITSEITYESIDLSYGALNLGDHNLVAGVRNFMGEETFTKMAAEVTEVFNRAEFPDTVRVLDRHFGGCPYSLRTIFRDEQRRVLREILETTMENAEQVYRQLHEDTAPLMAYLSEIGSPVPKALRDAAEFTLNHDLQISLREEFVDPVRIQGLINRAKRWHLETDEKGLGFRLERRINEDFELLVESPEDNALLAHIGTLVGLADKLTIPVNLWQAQNIFYELVQAHRSNMTVRREKGDAEAQRWLENIAKIGKSLRVKVD